MRLSSVIGASVPSIDVDAVLQRERILIESTGLQRTKTNLLLATLANRLEAEARVLAKSGIQARESVTRLCHYAEVIRALYLGR